MAQWLGQFSGNTHATKVEDAEILLRHAVDMLRGVGTGLGREKHAKSVRRPAEQLLAARLKQVKARLAAAKDAQSGVALALRAGEIATLARRQAILKEGGLAAILREYEATDPPVA